MMANSRKQKLQISGVFTTPDGQEVIGDLHLKGRRAALRLQLKRELPPLPASTTINGELGDLRKVSCLECVVGSAGGGFRGDAGRYHYAEIFPHFVTVGDRHFAPDEPSIKAVHFTTPDLPSIFYDFGTFGHLHASKPAIESFLEECEPGHKIEFGESPEVVYFSGKKEVVTTETPIGLFRVSHRPTFSGGNSNGEFIKDRMVVSLEYSQPVVFDVCIDRVMSIHRFLSVVAGRKQGIESIHLDLANESTRTHSLLELHWVFAPKQAKNEDGKPRPADIPLDAVRRAEEFKAVLGDWLSREPEWKAARIRYAGCAGKGNSYSIDRLVAAANMFDILPQDAVPSASDLSPDVAKAQKECREIFKRLRPGVERDSILGALGRLNKPSLTKKVLHRVAIVNGELGNRFLDLDLVAKTAVKFRNFFVHGSSDGFDYTKLEPLMPFLTDALEFIFAASDLISAEWNAVAWGNNHYGFGHGFTRFRWSYREHVDLLKEALS
jgi:hypothetical protein